MNIYSIYLLEKNKNNLLNKIINFSKCTEQTFTNHLN